MPNKTKRRRAINSLRRRRRRRPPAPIHERSTMLAELDPVADPQIDSQSPPQQAPELQQDQHQSQSQLTAAAAAPPAPAPDLAVPDQPPPAAPPARKNPGGKRKKPGPGKKRLAEIREKLAFLSRNLRPVPFAPAQTLDVSRHERLFRALGLWDFAHLRLDTDVRTDLLALLIANYDPPNRRSYVHGKRVVVSRADLARALALSVKKDKDAKDAEFELFAGDETAGVVTDFIMNWLVFQGDDTCILPKEVVAAMQLVKEGQPHKVDWAGLVWTLVEKDLQEVPKSGDCYYASHLQCLMRHQQRELFSDEARAEPEMEAEAEQEPHVELAPIEEEDDTVKADCLEEIQDVGPENSCPGLTLGIGRDADAIVGLEECRVEGEEQWLSDGKNVSFEPCLRRCNMSDIGSMDCGNLIKDEEVKGVREEGKYEDDLNAKFASLNGYTSMELLEAVAVDNNDYGCAPDHYNIDPSTGDFLVMRTNPDTDMAMDLGLGGSPLYRNVGKRGISNIHNEENDVHHFVQGNHQHKRMRNDGNWEHTALSFDMCAEQAQGMVGKLKMLYAEKEQACSNAQVHIQFLNNMILQKDQIIHSLEKTRSEEKQIRDLEFSRFEHELKTMSRLVLGYKKALKETRSSFAEYRKQFSQGEKPLYKDVPGSGGLVLSTMEFERQRIQREEAACQAAMETVNSFKKEWFSKLNAYSESVCEMIKRVVKIDEDYVRLKERFAQSKENAI